ncbi:hypothetical protein [Roseibium aggregatum]|uniref:Uncharacterized protein n=1 Tax=Roseibium aggregatum TaxID=187304 RepID=A0A939EJM0_9HYPH|nr:hypothetical protein [Roseibium aggregatum]MBN9673523.1 hypothetical protein [Roseibium aggregatum]
MQYDRKIAGNLPQSSFQRGYGQFQYKNSIQSLFDFTVRLPDNWTAFPVVDKVPVEQAPVTVLMTAHGADEKVEFIVWGVLLGREINPIDWMDGWLRSQSLRALDIQARKSSYGVLADVLATGSSKDGVTLHRFATIKDGNRLFLLEMRSPATPTETARHMQTVFFGALTGFSLKNPTNERFAEAFAFEQLGGASPLQVAVAGSWQKRVSDNAPDGGAALQLDNSADGTSLGTIFIVTSPVAGDEAALEEVTLENLAANGISLVPDSGAFGIVKGTPLPSKLARIDAKRGHLGLEATLLRAGSADVSVSALLLSPARETNFEAWAINRRAFEIVVESLQPLR